MRHHHRRVRRNPEGDTNWLKIGGVVVAAYLGYRWWTSRHTTQSAAASSVLPRTMPNVIAPPAPTFSAPQVLPTPSPIQSESATVETMYESGQNPTHEWTVDINVEALDAEAKAKGAGAIGSYYRD